MEETILQGAKEELERVNGLLRKARDRVESLEQERLAEEEEPLKDIATRMHEVLCQYNHTDGCGWHYEVKDGVHNWTGWAHARWLKKAHDLTKGDGKVPPISPADIVRMLIAIEQLKAVNPWSVWLFRYGNMKP